MARTYALWFRQQYRLAPTDPRFLQATAEEIEAEYWAYHYQANPAQEEYEDDEFDLEAEKERIRAQAEAREAAQANGTPPATGDDDWEEVKIG
ncbi:hypothetical protein [Paraburkholderia sp. MM6662-R1]|uniref:hypothetical protein n=1 Tax=Paraburkholderia sp. MM6662-R1 TaxID=2991066 RepID=UPI003D2336B1